MRIVKRIIKHADAICIVCLLLSMLFVMLDLLRLAVVWQSMALNVKIADDILTQEGDS